MLTLFQFLVFAFYVGGLLIYFKKPLPSISDSWYELPRNWNHLFTLFCWSLGFSMFFQGTGETPLFFISGAGLMFVGAATQFKWKGAHTNVVHYMGALVGIMGALIGIAVEYHSMFPLIIWAFTTLVLGYYEVKNFTWWVEIAAFMTIVGGLFFK